MDIFAHLDAFSLTLAVGFALLAGLIKGMTGFAMPLILVSSLASFLSPELALAGLILPTLVTNLWQAFRQGIGAALSSARAHGRFLAIALVSIAISSQLVTRVSTSLMFTILGLTITGFTLMMLAGWKPRVSPENRRATEVGVGVVAGTLGGFSGTWGPPTVMYLTALDTPKTEHVRVQGIVYASGAVVLTLAHLKSGVLAGDGAALSFLLLPPALIGMALGVKVQDKLDQQKFRTVVLVVLAFAGLNLIRRGVLG